MRPFFTEVTTSAGEGIYKSDPVIFLRAVSRLDFEPDEAVHVGDHARFDVQTARSAGLHTVWFAAHASVRPISILQIGRAWRSRDWGRMR